MTRAGMVTFVGKPNAGKSTLMNRIVGEKLSIVSPKPQTTRDRVVGIRSSADSQMIILDTPGLLEPGYALQEAMKQTALRALTEADVIVHVHDVTEGDPPSLKSAAGLDAEPHAPIILALNKSDQLGKRDRERVRSGKKMSGAQRTAEGIEVGGEGSSTPVPEAELANRMLVSALSGDGVPELVAKIESMLPESPFYYPADEISTLPVRFFAAELVRETVLEQLRDEVPYSIACEVEEYRDAGSPKFIRAVIYVERESQKGIVVGAKGAAIKKIGEHSRRKIESFIGERVYLELHVKVLPNWRRDSSALSRFGYQLLKGKSK
ncbi:MAG: GTPase Era [Gemmatimonadota bacterium]|nr:GTPase Era [Gemmatimonadota bacterium]